MSNIILGTESFNSYWGSQNVDLEDLLCGCKRTQINQNLSRTHACGKRLLFSYVTSMSRCTFKTKWVWCIRLISMKVLLQKHQQHFLPEIFSWRTRDKRPGDVTEVGQPKIGRGRTASAPVDSESRHNVPFPYSKASTHSLAPTTPGFLRHWHFTSATLR